MSHILVLGGTTEASALARGLAERGLRATLSYAGRTEHPRAQPVPVRIGGFGGVEGLARWMAREQVTHLVDATHPFAATMSSHAAAAAQRAGIAFVRLTRPAWEPVEGDRWNHVADVAGAVAALGGPAQRVMLALGRMHVAAFAAQPQHHYLLRFVDVPDEPPPLPDHHLVVDRGPFTVAGDMALMKEQGIDLIVAKNAGGSGARAKLDAARALALPVMLIDRPPLPDARTLYDVAEVLDWINHAAVQRGV